MNRRDYLTKVSGSVVLGGILSGCMTTKNSKSENTTKVITKENNVFEEISHGVYNDIPKVEISFTSDAEKHAQTYKMFGEIYTGDKTFDVKNGQQHIQPIEFPSASLVSVMITLQIVAYDEQNNVVAAVKYNNHGINHT